MILSTMEYIEKLSKDMLYRLQKKYTNIPYEDLEDVIQDCLLKYLQKYGSLDSISPQWLMTACCNRLIDVHRHNSHSVPLEFELVSNPDGEVLIDISQDSEQKVVRETALEFAYPETSRY